MTMLDTGAMELPEIPGKRYFTIGEVSKLCDIKPHVLRYWEQEFDQLKPVKRRGNRRYYQRHEVKLVRVIRQLLYIDGFTISGARTKLDGLDAKAVEAGATDSLGTQSKTIITQVIKELDEVVSMLR
jgi:DNA-binding transcriptional MerR regulator